MNPESINSPSTEQQDSAEVRQQVAEVRQQTDDQQHPSDQQSDRKSGPDQKSNQKSDIVNPAEDLVYKGGYTVDPVTLLGNPAVAPQTLSDARDLRADIFQDAEESTPDEA